MISKLFNGPYLSRLDNIIQWQEVDVFQKESVSQHSFKVFAFARILLEDIFKDCCEENREILDYKLKCVTLAGFHDLDEALLLRDLSHKMKYNDFNGTDVRRVLNEYSHHQSEEAFFEIDENKNQTSASKILINCVSPEDSGHKILCKICDWLALLFFIKREIDMGNKKFEKEFNLCVESIEKLQSPLKVDLISRFPDCELNFSFLSNLINEIKNYEGK